MFKKSLAKFYIQWFRDSQDSIVYCMSKGNTDRAEYYRACAKHYLNIIQDHWDAIEFFSIGDRAFLYDWALPEQFRGYE